MFHSRPGWCRLSLLALKVHTNYSLACLLLHLHLAGGLVTGPTGRRAVQGTPAYLHPCPAAAPAAAHCIPLWLLRPPCLLPLQEQVLRLCTEVFGARHPTTLTALNNLALCIKLQGRDDEALPLLVRAGMLLNQQQQPASCCPNPDPCTLMPTIPHTYILVPLP